MFNLPNNISKRERIVRGIIGGLLVIGAALLGKMFAILIGILLLAEAGINYCGVVDLIERFKLDGGGNSAPPENKP
jgi:hypothetical protein